MFVQDSMYQDPSHHRPFSHGRLNTMGSRLHNPNIHGPKHGTQHYQTGPKSVYLLKPASSSSSNSQSIVWLVVSITLFIIAMQMSAMLLCLRRQRRRGGDDPSRDGMSIEMTNLGERQADAGSDTGEWLNDDDYDTECRGGLLDCGREDFQNEQAGLLDSLREFGILLAELCGFKKSEWDDGDIRLG